jgi:hypothetical protein
VTVRTGAETVTFAGPFVITPAPPPAPPVPRLTGASPRAGARGATVEVEITGADTAFADGASAAVVSGDGVRVLSTRVTSPTEAFALLKLAPDAPLGLRDLVVRTAGREAVLHDGFEVTSARAAPAPTPPPGTTHIPATCTDRARPSAAFSGVSVKHRTLTLHGRAHDSGCAAEISVAGRVARVELAISRRSGKRCRFVAGTGRLGSPRACSRPVFLRAKGTTRWTMTLNRKLPRGTHTVLVRARDAAGNLTARPAKRIVKVR